MEVGRHERAKPSAPRGLRTLLPVRPARSLLAALAAALLSTFTVSVVTAPPAAAADATCALNGTPCGDMVWHGGPVMTSLTSYTIYWDPGDNIPAAYRNGLNTFFHDLGFDTFYDVVLQYPGSNGAPQDAASFGGSWIDTTPYPAGRPGTQANPLTNADIHDAILRALAVNPSWGPPGYTRAYHVLLPKGVYVEVNGVKSFEVFCAFHSAFGPLSNPVIYATLPYAGTDLDGCGTGGVSPSGDPDIDATTNIASHELMEMVTDPVFDGWYFGDFQEISNMCAFVFGKRAADGGNVTLNGHRYILQLEWSNADDTDPPDYHAACVGGWTPVRRIAGPDRIDTAVLTSRDIWAPVGRPGSRPTQW